MYPHTALRFSVPHLIHGSHIFEAPVVFFEVLCRILLQPLEHVFHSAGSHRAQSTSFVSSANRTQLEFKLAPHTPPHPLEIAQVEH